MSAHVSRRVRRGPAPGSAPPGRSPSCRGRSRAALALGHSTPAAGEQPPLDCSWDAPPGCPDRETVLEPLEAVLPVPLAGQLGAGVVADVDARGRSARWLGGSVQARLRVGGWGFGVFGVVLPAQSRAVVGGSVEFEPRAAGLRVCRAPWARRATGSAAPSGRPLARGRLSERRARTLHRAWQRLEPGSQRGARPLAGGERGGSRRLARLIARLSHDVNALAPSAAPRGAAAGSIRGGDVR